MHLRAGPEVREDGSGRDPAAPAFREELTPTAFIERAGTVFASQTAVIDGQLRLPWSAFRDRSRKLASALRRRGVKRGDRVAILAFNSEALLLAHFGVPQSGAVLVAINTRLNPREVAEILEHSQSTLLLVSPGLRDSGTVADYPERIELGDEFETLLETGSDEPLGSLLESENDLIAIDYTSGTTGRPKGVMYSHRGAYLNALGMVIENRLTSETRHLWTLPMFHCNGWSHTWAMAAAGAASVCVPRIDPSEIWQLLRSERITSFNAAPTVLIMLADDANAVPLSDRVRVATGGAPPSPTLIRRLEALNIEVVHLYGLTESYGPFSINVPPARLGGAENAEKRATYMARQGFAHVTAGQLDVMGTDARPTPPDGVSMGELVLRGNTVAMGYYKDPNASAVAFSGGVFHTGDLGVMHPDGSVEILDRQKDIIISGGENISTIEVEQMLMRHPDVLEAAVIAVPHPVWGEVPKAFVTLRAGRTESAQALIDYVRSNLAHFKAPRTVAFGPLPKTSTGKIQKYVLRERERLSAEPPPG
jgi:fatty-acyl-CoA synthase